jgi:hypothetical protein
MNNQMIKTAMNGLLLKHHNIEKICDLQEQSNLPNFVTSNTTKRQNCLTMKGPLFVLFAAEEYHTVLFCN